MNTVLCGGCLGRQVYIISIDMIDDSPPYAGCLFINRTTSLYLLQYCCILESVYRQILSILDTIICLISSLGAGYSFNLSRVNIHRIYTPSGVFSNISCCFMCKMITISLAQRTAIVNLDSCGLYTNREVVNSAAALSLHR